MICTSNQWLALCLVAIVFAFRFAVMAGVVWLIGWHDWSAWWFVPACFVAFTADVEVSQGKDISA